MPHRYVVGTLNQNNNLPNAPTAIFPPTKFDPDKKLDIDEFMALTSHDIEEQDVLPPNVVIEDGTLRILNVKPSADIDAIATLQTAVLVGAIQAEDLQAMKPKVDLRDDVWFKVQDQGQDGSCVGFAAGNGVLRYVFTMLKKLNPGELLSAEILWGNSKETDTFNRYPSVNISNSGTSLVAALDVAKTWGVVRATSAKYDKYMYPGDDQRFLNEAALLRINSYINLGRSIDNWKKWLTNFGSPILIAIQVDDNFMKPEPGGYVNRYNPQKLYGGHAICIVGYDDTKKHLIIRNSWGESWGDKGHCYMSYEVANLSITESYAVSAA